MNFRVGLLIFGVATGVFMLIDAPKKGIKSSMAYAMFLLNIMFPYVVFPLYLMVRPKLALFSQFMGAASGAKASGSDPKNFVLCTRCGNDNPQGSTECEECHNKLGL